MAFILEIVNKLLSWIWGPGNLSPKANIKLDTTVKYPVKPSDLLNRHYWLNGRTQLTYLYTNFWGTHVFKVGGLCDKHKTKRTIVLSSEEVARYLSNFIEYH